MRLLKLEIPDCGSCRNLTTLLNNVGVEYKTVDMSVNPDIASKYSIMSAPVLILLDEEGEEVDRVSGYFPDQVSELLDKM